MTTPNAARLKFWFGPPEKISLNGDLPVLLRDSAATASLIPMYVCCTDGSLWDLPSRAQMTARASVLRPSFASLYDVVLGCYELAERIKNLPSRRLRKLEITREIRKVLRIPRHWTHEVNPDDHNYREHNLQRDWYSPLCRRP